jgi:hypothetical protein
MLLKREIFRVRGMLRFHANASNQAARAPEKNSEFAEIWGTWEMYALRRTGKTGILPGAGEEPIAGGLESGR